MQVPVPVPWRLSVGDEAQILLVTAALGIRHSRVIRKLRDEHSLLAVSDGLLRRQWSEEVESMVF